MVEFLFNDAELNRVITARFTKHLKATAESIAKTAQADCGKPVAVSMGENKRGRPVAFVTIKHAAGQYKQARHGTLTKAAAKHGFIVGRYLHE